MPKFHNYLSTTENLATVLDDGSADEGDVIGEVNDVDDEISDDARTIIKLDDELGKAIDAAKTMDELQACVVDTSGLNAREAVIVNQTLESIRLNLNLPAVAVPTFEALNGTHSKFHAVRMTTEGLVSTAKDTIRYLIELMKSLAMKTIDFLANVFKSTALMEKRIKQLEARRKEASVKAYQPKQSTVKGLFVKGLSFRTDSDQQTIYKIIETCAALEKGYDYAYQIIQAIRDRKFDLKSAEQPSDILHGVIRDLQNNMGFLSIALTPKLGVLFGSLPGGVSIVFNMSDKDKSKAITYHTNLPEKETPPSEMDALNVADIHMFLTDCQNLLNKLKKMQAHSSSFKDLMNGIIRGLETEYSRLRGAMGNEEHAAKLVSYEKTKAVQTLLTKIIGRWPGYIFSTVKHLSDYCDASLRNLKPI